MDKIMNIYEHALRLGWTKQCCFFACKSACRPAEQRNSDGRQLELHIQDLRRMAPPRAGPISARGQRTLVALCGSHEIHCPPVGQMQLWLANVESRAIASTLRCLAPP
eukprot:s1214_g23.t1